MGEPTAATSAEVGFVPRLMALERCDADRCEYVAWLFVRADGFAVTVSIAGPPHSVFAFPTIEEAAEHFGATVDAAPQRHISAHDLGAADRQPTTGTQHAQTAGGRPANDAEPLGAGKADLPSTGGTAGPKGGEPGQHPPLGCPGDLQHRAKDGQRE